MSKATQTITLKNKTINKKATNSYRSLNETSPGPTQDLKSLTIRLRNFLSPKLPYERSLAMARKSKKNMPLHQVANLSNTVSTVYLISRSIRSNWAQYAICDYPYLRVIVDSRRPTWSEASSAWWLLPFSLFIKPSPTTRAWTSIKLEPHPILPKPCYNPPGHAFHH